MGKKRDRFRESAMLNTQTYLQYRNRLFEVSLSMWDWQNLPKSIDPRTLEYALVMNGRALFFVDEVMGMLALDFMPLGGFDVDGIPRRREAYSRYNGYRWRGDRFNSVVCYNNLMRINSVLDIEMFATRLYNLDRTIDVNVNGQKTPILLQGDEKEKLTLENLYMQYQGNMPVIMAYNSMEPTEIKAISTAAPYVSDKLYDLKTMYWNEALTYLGVSNVNIIKKERMTQEEVTRNLGGAVASRKSRLKARQRACELVNKMFGVDIWVEYDENFIAPGLPGSETELENVSRETLSGGDVDE